MEDIDAYINKLKGEQEMKDYIDKGIYPESLISEYTVIHMPKLQETKIDDIDISYDTSIFDFQMIQDGLTTVENEIRNAGSPNGASCSLPAILNILNSPPPLRSFFASSYSGEHQKSETSSGFLNLASIKD